MTLSVNTPYATRSKYWLQKHVVQMPIQKLIIINYPLRKTKIITPLNPSD